jgi:hypothetical protein
MVVIAVISLVRGMQALLRRRAAKAAPLSAPRATNPSRGPDGRRPEQKDES